jgi:hypothetical protein
MVRVHTNHIALQERVPEGRVRVRAVGFTATVMAVAPLIVPLSRRERVPEGRVRVRAVGRGATVMAVAPRHANRVP